MITHTDRSPRRSAQVQLPRSEIYHPARVTGAARSILIEAQMRSEEELPDCFMPPHHVPKLRYGLTERGGF